MHTDILYAGLLFPRLQRHRSTDMELKLRKLVLREAAMFYFVPYLYADVSPSRAISVALDQFLRVFDLQSTIHGDAEGESYSEDSLTAAELRRHDGPAFRAQLEADLELAGLCIERATAHVAASRYDVVGLSCQFEHQLPGGLALASRIKAISPGCRIIFGGSACFGAPADELVKGFPFIDAVCHSEGDQLIVPLVRALAEGASLAGVPGISWVDQQGRAVHNPVSAFADRYGQSAGARLRRVHRAAGG